MEQQGECPCLQGDTYYQNFEERSLGVDRDFGEATVWECKRCGRYWLECHIDCENLTAAGRWFRGVVNPDVAASAQRFRRQGH